MKKPISFTAMLRIAALALLVPAAVAFAAQTPDSATISKLLLQARNHAAQAEDDARYLYSGRFSNLAPRSHAMYLEKVKEHVNELAKDYGKLQMLRENGTPQQREAIDQLEPLLREMALSLTNTIRAFNENPGQVNLPPFRNRIDSDWSIVNAVYQHLRKCSIQKSKI